MSHDPQTHDHTDDPAHCPSRGRLWLAVLSLIALLLAVATIGTWTRVAHGQKMAQQSSSRAVPTVKLVKVSAHSEVAPLALPGRMQAFTTAPIYARVDGYLKSRQVDIGDQVSAGQVLATISTPDLDQRIASAAADLESARADAALARTTARRYQSLAGTDAVSKQAIDKATGRYKARQAKAKAAAARLSELKAQKDFTQIRAPFAGRVTARNTDIGDLIQSGNHDGPALFTVAETAKLRAYVQIPQVFVPQITVGETAKLTVPEYPGSSFSAKVAAGARAIRPNAGTTPVQLIVDNADHRLTPGSYAQVTFDLADNSYGLEVPSSALIFDSKGMQVATLGSDSKVHLQQVTIGRDYGENVALTGGVKPGESIIDSPPDGLTDGTRVRVDRGDPRGGASKGERS
ncbi:efflux RND transporter periplasmic adaptor subunit [Salinisphaera sp. SPP-AMP-43]|uniref:efflux RND transporter periplasmic adaptor subunit n=1 Tax=Salinisphaera sp. SPP-AMP-43 TaxID=3121288 RepID=UPI003C6DE711